MKAMIHNDEEKEWMLPLLKFRDRLAVRNEEGKWDDRPLRDYRRIHGGLTQHNGRLVHGPYKQATREAWLKELLLTQRGLQERGPEYVRDVELLTLEELEEIRRIWVVEKHEIEDSLPRLFEEALGKPYPGRPFHENSVLGSEELALLKETCSETKEGEAGDELYSLLRGLLDVEQRFRTMTKRKGLYPELESVLRFHAFEDEEEAQREMGERERRKEKALSALAPPLQAADENGAPQGMKGKSGVSDPEEKAGLLFEDQAN